ncbi:MAG TPA: SRPBCC family protein [Roseiflexaceae bacterium]|nr:SRPBCC family protein [Roseiflexaceae bacterium]
MPKIVSSIAIAGSPEAIFDLVTTASHWPAWHPATIGVGGVTECPFALGDVVEERARIGGRMYEGAWTVAQHERPRHTLLRGGSGRISIAYHFEPGEDGVTFRRELMYDEGLFGGAGQTALEDQMRRESDEALRRLKALVEGLLQR